jgi:hypothetical protein
MVVVRYLALVALVVWLSAILTASGWTGSPLTFGYVCGGLLLGGLLLSCQPGPSLWVERGAGDRT